MSSGPPRDEDAPRPAAEIYAIYVLPQPWREGHERNLLETAMDHWQDAWGADPGPVGVRGQRAGSILLRGDGLATRRRPPGAEAGRQRQSSRFPYRPSPPASTSTAADTRSTTLLPRRPRRSPALRCGTHTLRPLRQESGMARKQHAALCATLPSSRAEGRTWPQYDCGGRSVARRTQEPTASPAEHNPDPATARPPRPAHLGPEAQHAVLMASSRASMPRARGRHDQGSSLEPSSPRARRSPRSREPTPLELAHDFLWL